MRRLDVAIIGAGPRGLAVLERLSALLCARDIGAAFVIHVIDPGIPGQGIHRDDQPDHLPTNTAAGSTTVFVDDSVTGAGPACPGPSVRQWLDQSGYRMKDGKLVRAAGGEPVKDDMFVPRAILGRYLAWAYRQFVARMPANAEVVHHRCRAIGLARTAGDRFAITLDEGPALDIDFVFLTTGHSGSGPQDSEAALERRVAAARSRNPGLAYLRMLDPIERLDDIDATARVAICGMGLTALDAISMFTHGRGGTFSKAGAQTLKYQRSGDEPRITLFSRQGLPLVSKAVNQRVAGKGYKPKFFTTEFVERRRKGGKLDWTIDLLPCLKKEMAFRLANGSAGAEHDKLGYEPSPEHARAVDAFLHPWNGHAIGSPEAHAAFVEDYLRRDVAASFVGNVDDPFKAIVEMVRDLNDVVRFAVDHAGLTPASHEAFLRDWCSINNRIAAGPPKERGMEMLALIEAGVLSVFEPRPRVALDDETACFEIVSDAFGYTHRACFDVLIQARVGLLQPDTSPDPLLRSGLDSGLFAAFDNQGFAPSGIAIDENLNIVGAGGRSLPNGWAMGYVVEGAHYYTYVLPCPFANSRSLRDAGRAVTAMIDQVIATTASGNARGERLDLRIVT